MPDKNPNGLLEKVQSVVAGIAMLATFCSPSLLVASPVVRQIKIQSQWSGLGTPQQTTVVIQYEQGVYKLGRNRVDAASVEALVEAIKQPAIPKPTLEGLDLTTAWLQQQIADIPNKATWWKLKGGTPRQRELFEKSFTDPDFVSTVLPSLFSFSRTDDYPSIEITLTRDDGSIISVSSHSQYSFMLPWDISTAGDTLSTFNSKVSSAIAKLMPKKATNRERILDEEFNVELGEAVMKHIEGEWNLLGVEDKAGSALAILRTRYTVKTADINPYHDVAFGTKWNKGKGEEENLHATLQESDFPKNFYDTVILLYKDGQVSGAEEFIRNAGRQEQLVLSVPWLVQVLAKYQRLGISLLWVHDQSFSDKAMQNFAADMHVVGRDDLAEEVRRVRKGVALLSVSYGDYWLVLPDRRMVLWRYESVMGLLGFSPSDFARHECTDYQAVTGGCVGKVVSSNGELENDHARKRQD